MISRIHFILIVFSLFWAMPVLSQSIKDVRINEIQVHNADGFRNEYGQASSWIELHNTGYGKVDVAGCTLKVKGVAYKIPKGDPSTIMPKKGYHVFYADGISNRGTFYTNFTLENTDFIALYDIDGELIHRFDFDPAQMIEGVSFGYFGDYDGKERLMQLPATTPGGTNETEEKESRSEVFRRADPTGIILTFINIAVVTIALTLLFFVFKYMGRYHVKKAEKKRAAIHTINGMTVNTKKKEAVTNDELAAIAIALYKYVEDLHVSESSALTINMTSKFYSPWSSKIYTLRQNPNKK